MLFGIFRVLQLQEIARAMEVREVSRRSGCYGRNENGMSGVVPINNDLEVTRGPVREIMGGWDLWTADRVVLFFSFFFFFNNVV